MSSHVIIVFIINLLSTCMQLDFQARSKSPFETHSRLTSIFFVVLLAYSLTWGMTINTIEVPPLNDPNDNIRKIMGKISLFLGALASILLMIIVFPFLGWTSFVLWLLFFFLKYALELVNFELFEAIERLSK